MTMAKGKQQHQKAIMRPESAEWVSSEKC